MRFSIITVCYNPGKSISDTIESVLSQDYPDIEHIIVDGHSTDGTVELVRSYGDKISTFVSEPDEGLYDALNKGINLAAGDVIGFVHSDDSYADSSVLSSIARTFETSKADAVYGDLVYVSRGNPDRVVRYWRSGSFSPSRLRFGWMPPHPALYITKTVYEKAKLANGQYFDTDFACAADYDFMMRLLTKHKVRPVYLPKIIVKMRLGGVSNGSLKYLVRKSREDYLAMKRNNIGGLNTLVAKNFRKLPQFLNRRVTP